MDGGSGNDTESGGSGNDTFVEDGTSNGSDVFQGGPGTDTVSYANRKSALKVTIDGVANDGAAGEADNVKRDVENLIGGSGKDTLTGSAAANVLSGGSGNDRLSGGAGNDKLTGGPCRDTLLGGPGNDIFFAGDRWADIVNGGAGKDVARTYDHKLDKLISIP
jgi:Ca2+-binding RTX toxin-like protein